MTHVVFLWSVKKAVIKMNTKTVKIHFQQHDILVKLPKGYDERRHHPYPLMLVQEGYALFKDIEADVIFADLVPNDRKLELTPWHAVRSEEHTSELQSRFDLVCRLLLEKK